MPLSVRIATFNVEDFGERTDEGADFAARAAALVPLLRRLEADVLCLQEVNAQHRSGEPHRVLSALDRMLENTPYAGFHRAAMASSGGDYPADKHNIVVLSRWPIGTSAQIRHDLLPPVSYRAATARPATGATQDLTFERPFVYAGIDLPNGRVLHVVNLHLKAPLAVPVPGQKQGPWVWKSVPGWAEGFLLASIKRASQAVEVRMYIDRLFEREAGAFVAVCGDFNADAHEVPVRIIQADVDDTGNPSLAAHALASLDGRLPAERRFTVLHGGRRVMLDHILVSPALASACREFDALNSDLIDEAPEQGPVARPAGSFHAPLVAAFHLPD